MRSWLLATITFSFHLPAFNAVDSCQVGVVPLDDLDSCFVWRQVQGQPPRILYRTRQAGQEGALKQFTDQDTMSSAIYWVETSDDSGNVIHLGAPCGPNVVQWARTTDVPTNQPPPAVAVAEPRFYDVLGRRIHGVPTWPGVYWKASGTTRRLVIVK